MQTAGEDLVRVVKNMPLFEGMDVTVIAEIAAAAALRNVAAKETVYWQGDAPRAIYYVLSGHVRRAIISAEGEEKLIDVVSPGQQFGLAELFGNPHHVSFAEAVETTLLLEISRDGLLPAVEANPQLSLRVLSVVAARHLAFEQEVAATYFHSGCRRLLDYLLHLAGTNPDAAAGRMVALPISKGLLAEHLGITAETLSRAFRDLSEAGLISVHGRRITLLAKIAARRPTSAEAEAIPPHQRKRRRSDPWVEPSALALPVGSRAWL